MNMKTTTHKVRLAENNSAMMKEVKEEDVIRTAEETGTHTGDRKEDPAQMNTRSNQKVTINNLIQKKALKEVAEEGMTGDLLLLKSEMTDFILAKAKKMVLAKKISYHY